MLGNGSSWSQQMRLEVLYLGRIEGSSGELLGLLHSDQEHTINLHLDVE